MYTTHKVKTRPDRWAGQKCKAVKNSKPYTNYQNIRWSEYHKTNPHKGSTGYIGPDKFARVIAKEWEELQIKDQQLHAMAKRIDADHRSEGKGKCKHCGEAQSSFRSKNSFQSHQSRCLARASIDTAALPIETTNPGVTETYRVDCEQVGRVTETYRVDCEQVGSDWNKCHEGQECMSSTEQLNGEIPLPTRDTCTTFTMNDGSLQFQIDEQAKCYTNQPDWGSVIRRVATDVESGKVIQDLDLKIAAAAS